MNEVTALNMRAGLPEHATSEDCWGVIKGNTREKYSSKSPRQLVCNHRWKKGWEH